MVSHSAKSATLKSWRELTTPSSCSLKINKDSQLTNNKYESPHFSSGGYNWRLVVYPKGNEEDNGSGFVSMYVELDNASTPSMEVFAYLTFFVFNKKENNYLSVQDVEVKRFDSSRTVWGSPQVLSAETFSDPEKGYIFDEEQCEFGAHVMMMASPEVLSLNEILPFHKFVWKVKDFSLLKENDYVSKSISMRGRNWDLKLYLKGKSRADNKLSFYVHLAEPEILLPGQGIFVRAQLRVLDPRGSTHLEGWSKSWRMASTRKHGIVQSMSLAKIQEAYLDIEDSLDVEIECEVINTITNHPLCF